MEWWQTAGIAFISGGGAGALISLGTPWSTWGVEKKREKLAHRRKVVSDARDLVDGVMNGHSHINNLRSDRRFIAVRSHLSRATRRLIDEANGVPFAEVMARDAKWVAVAVAIPDDLVALERSGV